MAKAKRRGRPPTKAKKPIKRRPKLQPEPVPATPPEPMHFEYVPEPRKPSRWSRFKAWLRGWWS